MNYEELISQCNMYIKEIKETINSPEKVAEIIRPLITDIKQEMLFVCHLSSKNDIIKIENVSKGMLNQTLISSREIFRTAIIEGSAGIIIAHNHPSGNPKPSTQDIKCTKRLLEASKIIDIPIVDHLIIVEKNNKYNDFISMKEECQYILDF